MNAALLRNLKKTLQKYHLSSAEEARVLRVCGAETWLQKTLKSIPPQFMRAVSAGVSGGTVLPSKNTEPLILARKLFEAAPAGPEGTENAFTPEFFALARESAGGKNGRRGVFYTPWPVARLLCRETLRKMLTQNGGLSEDEAHACLENNQMPLAPARAQKLDAFLEDFRIADPACGAGGLLIPFWLELAALRRRLNPKYEEAQLLLFIAQNNLYAADIDPRALEDLRLRLSLTLAQKGVFAAPKTLLPHAYCGDALDGKKTSVWFTRFSGLSARGGFDAMISNPPYVGQKNHREIFEKLRQNPRWTPFITPKGDLLYLFVHLALEILKPQGIAGFLTTAYFAQAASAAPLRARLQKETVFLRLVDFGNERLFKRAPGQHNLLSVFQKTDAKTALCQTGAPGEEIAVSQNVLYTADDLFLNTRAADETTQNLLDKMAAAPERLKDAAHISNGLMTGCDKISAAHLRRHHLPGVQKGAGVFVLSEAEKNKLSLSPKEAEKLKPFFKNSAIRAYAPRTTPDGFLIDFFYPNDKNTDFALYPNLMEHLARFKTVLSARKQNNNGIDKQLKKGRYWFGSVRRKMNFEGEKIAAAHRSKTNAFAYTPGPWYASSDVYFISGPAEGISLWYLLALLNSAPYYVWLAHCGKRKGRLLELYAQPLENLPLPNASAAQRKRLEELARQIYRLKRCGQHTRALEEEADRLTGRLFDLTKEEIRLAQRRRNQARPQNAA